jgi:hypothetical protein
MGNGGTLPIVDLSRLMPDRMARDLSIGVHFQAIDAARNTTEEKDAG